MPNSQNGWPVGGAIPFSVAGVSFPGGLRGGDVGGIFDHVLNRFHHEVENLHPGWCWGYAYRPVRGQTSGLSNHSSGTAVDVNAPNHPLGKRGTFNAAQVRAIRAILAEVTPAIRWGGDYTGRVDEMHFEINCSAAALSQVVARLRAHTPPRYPAVLEQEETMANAYPVMMPPTRTEGGPEQVREISIPLIWQGGVTGTSELYVAINNTNRPLKIVVAEWQLKGSGGHGVTPALPPGTIIAPLETSGGLRAPAGSYALIIDYDSELGASALIEAR